MNNGQSALNECRVLVLTPTAKDADLTSSILARAGIDTLACRGLDDACMKLEEGAGALLVAEEDISGKRADPLVGFLERQASWSDLPIMVLARRGADSSAVAMAMDRLGNVTVLERPTRIVALVSSLRAALRARRRQYQLRDEEMELRAAHDELERRVLQRTERLMALNNVLEDQISERKAAERRAHVLLRELVTAQENERARIARDLHDELGQQMTSLRLQLAAVARDTTDSRKTRADLARIEQQADRMDAEISFLAWEIRPTNLERAGLRKAVKSYVNEWSRNFRIHARFRSMNSITGQLLPEIEVNIYRMIQEALNNIAKHAGATEVNVLLDIGESEVRAIIEDNGVGFDSDVTPVSKGNGGLGLRGLSERAELLGGTVQIESTAGVGTTVFIRIPTKYMA